MQKKILAVLALSLISSNAFASRAKNLVTGTGDGGNFLGTAGNNGSFYTNDEYNMFWNPAFVAGMSGMAIVEKSNGDGSASAGFVSNMGSISTAVFFNRDGVTHGSKPFDIIVGGGSSMKWGVGVTQTTSETESSTNLKAGIVMGSFEPFVSYLLSSSNGATGTAEQTSANMNAGLRYHWGDWAPYAVFGSSSTEQNSTKTVDQSTWGVGLGRNAKMGDVKFNYAVSYFTTSNSIAGQRDTASLPINVNMETEATSWLTVRAGLGYTLMERGFDAADLADTTVRFGGSFHLGKADLDMVVGGGSAAGSIDSSAFDAANGFFSQASLTFRM